MTFTRYNPKDITIIDLVIIGICLNNFIMALFYTSNMGFISK